MSNLDVDLLASTFPLDDVKVDWEEVDRQWRDIISAYPEFATPCFTCQFFDECKTGAKHNPLTCDFLLEWFLKADEQQPEEQGKRSKR